MTNSIQKTNKKTQKGLILLAAASAALIQTAPSYFALAATTADLLKSLLMTVFTVIAIIIAVLGVSLLIFGLAEYAQAAGDSNDAQKKQARSLLMGAAASIVVSIVIFAIRTSLANKLAELAATASSDL